MNIVTILNTDKHIKAMILSEKLTHREIAFSYYKVGVQHCIAVDEADVPKALA